MTPITVTAETRIISGIMDHACAKLQDAICFLVSCNQLDESALEIDEFQATEIICDSMHGDMTLEDLQDLNSRQIYSMCYDELKAAM
jgi:hypothetical protein